MKKIILACVLTAISATSAVQANEYPQNKVLRPLTLTDGTVRLSGAVAYGEQHNDDNEKGISFNASYGLTDDLQIGFEGLTYSLFKNENQGFEIAVNAGLRGYFDNDSNAIGDSLGYGVSFMAKQVITNDFAITFATGYTFWNQQHIESKKEYTYSIGAMTNIAKNLTLSANYTFRDLKDFKQDYANKASLALNYALSPSMDIGFALNYSDFEEQAAGIAFHETIEKSAAIFANWRF